MTHCILVLDDAADWREQLAGVIQDFYPDVSVLTTATVEEAKRAFQQHAIDMALLDVRLDERNEEDVQGLTLAVELQKQYPSTKYILISGYTTEQEIADRFPQNEANLSPGFKFISKSNIQILKRLLDDAFVAKETKAQQVLIVDDVADWLNMLVGIVQDYFPTVNIVTATTLEEGRQRLREQQFDVAILDMRLDEADEDNQDGLLLAREIRRRHPRTHVFVVTGYATLESVRESMQPDEEGKRLVLDFIEKRNVHELTRRLKPYLPAKQESKES